MSFLPPSIGSTLEARRCEQLAAQSSCHNHAALPHTQILADTLHHLGLCLSDKPGKVTVARFHPQEVAYHLDGRADSCEYLGNEQMPQVHIKYSGFCWHLMPQFVADSIKKVMTLTRRDVMSSEVEVTYLWPCST